MDGNEKRKGVIKRESIFKAAARYMQNLWHDFVLPDFDPPKCGTANKEDFVKPYLTVVAMKVLVKYCINSFLQVDQFI